MTLRPLWLCSHAPGVISRCNCLGQVVRLPSASEVTTAWRCRTFSFNLIILIFNAEFCSGDCGGSRTAPPHLPWVVRGNSPLQNDRTQTCEAVPTADSDEDLLLDVVRQRERQLRTTNTTINHNYHLPSSLLPHYLAKNRVLSCAAFRHGVYEIHGYAPPLIGGGIKR